VSAETRAVFEWLLERCEEVDAGQRAAKYRLYERYMYRIQVVWKMAVA